MGAGCRLEVAGCVNTTFIIYLTYYTLSDPTPLQCKRAACAAPLLLRLLLILLHSRDITTALRSTYFPTKLLNPNPNHLNYMYDLDANPFNSAAQCDE
jgi:hypothetical protein